MDSDPNKSGSVWSPVPSPHGEEKAGRGFDLADAHWHSRRHTRRHARRNTQNLHKCKKHRKIRQKPRGIRCQAIPAKSRLNISAEIESLEQEKVVYGTKLNVNI